MTSLRTLTTATTLLVAILGATIAPAFAGIAHPVCVTKQHDCGKTAKISTCCCGEQPDGSDQSGPIQSKTQITAAPAALAVSIDAIADESLVRTAFRSRTVPRAEPVDLPTLFACLLI